MKLSRGTRWLLLIVQCVIGIALIWWVIRALGIDAQQLTERFTLSSIPLLLLGVLCFIAVMVLGALRYRLFLSPSPPMRYLFGTTLLQNALLTFMPWRTGEISYPLFLRLDYSVPVASSAATILAIRLTDLLIVLGVVLAGGGRLGLDMRWVWIVSAAAVLLVVLAILIPAIWRKGVRGWLQTAFLALRSVRHPLHLVGLVSLSLLNLALNSLMSALILRALALPIALLDIALFSAVTLLATLVPIHPPGGWGTIDSAQIVVLHLLGYAPMATAPSILAAHSVYTLLILVGGVAGWTLRTIDRTRREPGRGEMSSGGRWEAPDRRFAGHRDVLTRSAARYRFVAPHIYGTALDIGCGRGYGFESIQPGQGIQVGVDRQYGFLREARRNTQRVRFVCADGRLLPFADGSFESLIAFEVIEHVQDQKGFLYELRRIARADALIAISTPNRLFVSGGSHRPLARFHTHEYAAEEFLALLAGTFSSVTLFGQYDSPSKALTSRWIDRIPVRWKYLLPTAIQSWLSVVLRPPLRLEQCLFRTEDLGTVHTFIALCRP